MRAAVMCIGNELLMDEGVGPACGRYMLSRYAFPPEVEVVDRATMGMAIISDLRAYDYVLVLDAVDVPGAQPGELFSFAPEDAAPTPAGMTSLHDVRFADVLASAALLGVRCEGHCLGVQVENMSPSEFVMALTPRVAAAVPYAAQAAVRHLRGKLGLDVVDRAAEGDPLRAGASASGARDFSRRGVRSGEPSAEPLRLELPAVYGEADCTVAARYLAQGLAAVGAGGSWDGAVPARVEAVLPAGKAAAELAERFGLEGPLQAADAVDGGQAAYGAWVSPLTTDYDCDALIGACRDVVAGVCTACEEGVRCDGEQG